MGIIKTFVSTGVENEMYTLRTTAGTFIQNLSTDKEKALVKGKALSRELGYEFIPEIDLNEIGHRKRSELESAEPIQSPSEDVNAPQNGSQGDIEPILAPIKPSPLDSLSDEQLEAYNRVKAGENVFISGMAGCGKSHLIRLVSDKHTVLCAPSGIAALNIGGVTCHKLFGLPTTVAMDKDRFKPIPKDYKDLFHKGKIKRVILDEVSMLRADYLDLIDAKLKMVRKNNKPFGGVQMVAVGDFGQLSPIVSGYDRREYFKRYQSKFCFNATSWNFTTVNLTKVFRQEDRRQVKLLNSIRCNDEHAALALKIIQREAKPYDKDHPVLQLATINSVAEEVNNYWYRKLEGKERNYYANYHGKWSPSERPTDDSLKLKVGTRVIICANDSEGEYFNGNMGVVTNMITGAVFVRKDDGKEVCVAPFTWSKYKYVDDGSGSITTEVDAEWTQIPLKLGYSISVHKSQGMTLQEYSINAGRGFFDHGQLYVALSRAVDLRNISFPQKVGSEGIICSKEVREFYEE